jgi:ankyrin repeat protein
MKNLVIALCFALLNLTASADQNADLIKACGAGNLADVKALVEKGADVNYNNGTGTPLTYSLMQPEVLSYLIGKGAKQPEDNSALVTAAVYGSPEVIKILLDAGADPNKPLVTDASKSFQKLIDDEKAKGKEANKTLIKTWEGMVENMKKTPVTSYAATNLVTQTNCLDCMKLLADKGGKFDSKNAITGGNLLHEFAFSGRSKKARAEYNKTVMKPAIEKYGFVVPEWYSDESKMGSPDEIAKFLVSKGVDINAINGLKNAPLMEALNVPPSIFQEEVVVALINNGANVKIESILYGKPMLIAAGLGSIPVMEALLAHGANINDEFQVDDATTGQQLKGVTLLMWACAGDHLEMVKWLIKNGVDLKEEAHGRSLNRKTNCVTKVEGKHAMYFAIESGNIEIVKALLDAAGGWTKALVIQQMKQEQNIGMLTMTKCFDIGAYIPSKYAKTLGFEEIQKLLKSKMI